MEYHTSSVARANPKSLIVADMPFASYHESPEQAFKNAAKLIAAGAQMVKLEGGEWLAPTVEFISRRGVPVCAHLGLTPQSVHDLGGYRVQGRDSESALKIERDAKALESAGARMLVLELVPADLAEAITQSLNIPTIGIGAGASTTGQVLVLHDMLGITPGKRPRFVKNFLANSGSVASAVKQYVAEVQARSFPSEEHSVLELVSKVGA
jgi:3-methyl-2-oxobutanoate hydroxymethyltransferase